jgi:hypothetical protein
MAGDLPNSGTENGITMYTAKVTARDVTGHISAVVPDPMLNPGLAKRPAKKRQMIRDEILRETSALAIKAAKAGTLHKYTSFQP